MPGGEGYPGERLGLPPDGRGSLASWRARVAALVLDWAACMLIAVGFFGSGLLTGGGWRSWMILATFFVESTLLSAVAGGSFGQLVCRIAVIRLDRAPLGPVRAVTRAALVSLALPPTHVFEGLRALVLNHVFDGRSMATSFGLNLIYLAAASLAFSVLLQSARRSGSLMATGE